MNRLVVVGNGMAGIACVEQILRHAPKFEITIFGNETYANYNRILLSAVLAGEKSFDDIVLNGLDWYQQNGIDLRVGVRIIDVDPAAKTVPGDDGSVTGFDKLLLATGSLPIIPSIQDVKKDGVFVFRNLDDTRDLLTRSGPGVKAVVIGGGLLGLEAARGLQVRGCEVTVVHLMDTLMERQLDNTGGSDLAAEMSRLGITVLLGLSTKAILGNGKVEGVEFKGGGTLPADLVVIAAGISPNVELGRKAGLEVKRGIVVNDYMETSNPDIFAVGECVQHNGVCYGLIAPSYFGPLFPVMVAASALPCSSNGALLSILDENQHSFPLQGCRVAVQEYGVPNPELLAGLKERGARAAPVCVYEWALPEDTGPLRGAVTSILRGEVDVMLVTSSVQVRHLFQVAESMASQDALRVALAQVIIASIGPLTSDEVRHSGLTVDIESAQPKMGCLVRDAAEKGAPLLQQKQGQPETPGKASPMYP